MYVRILSSILNTTIVIYTQVIFYPARNNNAIKQHLHGKLGKRLGLRKLKQGNTTHLNISFPNEKRAAQVGFKPTTYCIRGRLRWDSNPRHTAYEADALPTELPRQLSWLGRINGMSKLHFVIHSFSFHQSD